MKKKDLPASFLHQMEKQGWDWEIYGTVYLKCASTQKLTGDDYHNAMTLAELGLMQVSRKPIWRGGSYVGQEVSFQNYYPVTGKQP